MAPTGFILFCNLNRSEIKKQLIENPNVLGPITLGTVQKALSIKWKELTENEREYYNTQASTQTHLIISKKSENKFKIPSLFLDSNNEILKFPNGQINKILKLDPSIKKVSSSVSNAINIASTLFLLKLITGCLEKAKYEIDADDIVQVIKKEGIRMKFLIGCLHLISSNDSQQILETFNETAREEAVVSSSKHKERLQNNSHLVINPQSVKLMKLPMKSKSRPKVDSINLPIKRNARIDSYFRV